MQTSPGSEASWPRAATLLGYGGLLPFVAGALGVAVLDGGPGEFAVRALTAYGAVILSFLGAVHWGLALRPPVADAGRILAIGVSPSLVGWVALLLPQRPGLALLAVGFGVFWLYEHRIAGARLLPAAYLDLRRSLTIGACSMLTLGLIALG